MPPTVSESVHIDAQPEVVWKLISDITRMGEWSPETTNAKWIKGATGPRANAQFRGVNQIGFRRWATTATVQRCGVGRNFEFTVRMLGIPIALWTYEIQPDVDQGCTLTESVVDMRPRWFLGISKLGSGVSDRQSHNRENIRRTLSALKTAAERDDGSADRVAP
jgi:hypothetical protein